MRHIAECLAALCLVTFLLALSVKSGAPTPPAEGAVAPHSTQAMGYDLVGSDGGVFVFGMVVSFRLTGGNDRECVGRRHRRG